MISNMVVSAHTVHAGVPSLSMCSVHISVTNCGAWVLSGQSSACMNDSGKSANLPAEAENCGEEKNGDVGMQRRERRFARAARL